MAGSILVVDDEHGRDFQACLEEAGHLVTLYRNGREAFDDINAGLRYELAIIYLSLPEYGGDDIISISKKLNPQVPVISISGYNMRPKGVLIGI